MGAIAYKKILINIGTKVAFKLIKYMIKKKKKKK